MTAHAYHHHPEALPPLVQTWARVGGERQDGPDGPGACYVLTEAELEAWSSLPGVSEAEFIQAAGNGYGVKTGCYIFGEAL